MAERFQRQYGIHTFSDNSAEQKHASIASQLGGFKSSMASLATNLMERKGVAAAEKAALAYDPSQAPTLSPGGNTAARTYNSIVTKSYQQSVENRSHVRLIELKERYKHDPAAYAAAVQKRRVELSNEAGDMAGIALTAFDTVAAGYETEIRGALMADAVDVAKTEESIRVDQARSIVMDYAARPDADEAVMGDLIAGFDNVVIDSEFTDPKVKQKELIAIRHQATERVYVAELNDYLDKGDIKGAAKWIRSIERRQVKDGKMSKIMAETGQTPEQLAEVLKLKLKDHGDLVAEAIDQEAKVTADEAAALALKGREVQKALADLGSGITVADVTDASPYLDEDEYREWLSLAKGKEPERNTIVYNQLYADIMAAHASEDYDRLADLEDEALVGFRKGLMTRAEYSTVIDEVKASRFAPATQLFNGLAKSAEQLGDMAATMGLVRARNDFNEWMKLNPDAKPEQAESQAESFINQRMPRLLNVVKKIEEGQADPYQELVNKYMQKHNNNRDDVYNDPDFYKEKMALDEQKERN